MWLVSTKIQVGEFTTQRYYLKKGSIFVQFVCLVIDNMGQQVKLSSVAAMRL
jgi:hypothetical protein